MIDRRKLAIKAAKKVVLSPAQEVILFTALDAYRQTSVREFDLRDLAVLCYEADRKTFGLKGYEVRHLDFNSFRSHLYGPRGLVERGFFHWKGNKACKSKPRSIAFTSRGLLIAADLKRAYMSIEAPDNERIAG